MRIKKDKADFGLLYEYALTLTGSTSKLEPSYCDASITTWKNVGFYLTYFVFRYVLDCKSYEEALEVLSLDVLERYSIKHFYTKPGRMMIGIGSEEIGMTEEEIKESGIPTFEAELSGNQSEPAILWGAEVALDILYHDIPPEKQVETALAHPSKTAYTSRNKTMQSVLDAMNTFARKAFIWLLVPLMTLMLSMSHAKADEIRFDPDGNFVADGGINHYDGQSCQSREETKELEQRLSDKGFVLFEKGYISDEEYDLMADYVLPPYWRDEQNYPPQKHHIYVPADSYYDALNQIREGGATYWYTDLELSFGTVMIDYFTWDQIDLIGTESHSINELVDPDFVAYLEITSPVSCEVKLTQNYTGQYFMLYVANDKPLMVGISEGIYTVSAINDSGISMSDGYLVLEHERDTVENPMKYSLSKLTNKYGIHDSDISDKPNLDINSDGTFGDSYKTDVQEEKQQTAKKSDKNIASKGIKWIVGGSLILLVLVGVGIFIYYKRNRRGL